VSGRPNAAGLVAEELSLQRDGRAVLSGASLSVPRGQVTALVAPSGAGKSTLLRCLNRLLEPDTGEILLDGTSIDRLEPRELRRRIGLVAQTPVMLPGSVAENVGYGLRELPEQRLLEALASAGLSGDFADRDASALSGGERARVALARAIARDPEFLLLDEPTAALDQKVADQIVVTLRRLAKTGLGICAATHDLRFAKAVADRTVSLDGAEAA
jgi:ABC-type multidrug transport system fused ATPase/permease subunit